MATVSTDPPTIATRPPPPTPPGGSGTGDTGGASAWGGRAHAGGTPTSAPSGGTPTGAQPSRSPTGAPSGGPRVDAGAGGVVRIGAATVRLRRVAGCDGPALTAVLERMSLRTRWLRFHSPIVRFSGAQLRTLLEPDHRDRSVLVAEVEGDSGRWQLVGFAQYARIAGDRADAAIVLEDAWQGRGIGRALALALVRAARAAGIVAFTSEILTENRRMLAFARALAPRTDGRLLGVTTELTCWLDPA
jgi:GNAT superfamily N-acetyltransferase